MPIFRRDRERVIDELFKKPGIDVTANRRSQNGRQQLAIGAHLREPLENALLDSQSRCSDRIEQNRAIKKARRAQKREEPDETAGRVADEAGLLDTQPFECRNVVLRKTLGP